LERAGISGPAGSFAPIPKSAEHGYTYELARDAVRLSGTREEIFVLKRLEGWPEARDVNLLVVIT